MEIIKLEFADDFVNRVQDAVCKRNGWDKDSPINKKQFTKKWLIEQLKIQVILHEAEIAERIAKKNVETDVETNLIIT